MSIFRHPPIPYFMHGLAAVVAAGAVVCVTPGVAGIVAPINQIFPTPGTVFNLAVRLSNIQPGSGSLVFTVLVNNAVTLLAINVPAGFNAGAGGTTLVNTINTTLLPDQALFRIQIQNNAAAASLNIGAVSFLFS